MGIFTEETNMCISKASTGDSLSTRMPSFTKDTTSSKQRICFGPFHQVLCAEHERDEKPFLILCFY